MIEEKFTLKEGLNPVYNKATGNWMLVCSINDDVSADDPSQITLVSDFQGHPDDCYKTVAGLFLSFLLKEKVRMIDLNPCRPLDSDFIAALHTIEEVTVMAANGTFVFRVDPLDMEGVQDVLYCVADDVPDDVYLKTYQSVLDIEDDAERHDFLHNIQYPDSSGNMAG